MSYDHCALCGFWHFASFVTSACSGVCQLSLFCRMTTNYRGGRISIQTANWLKTICKKTFLSVEAGFFFSNVAYTIEETRAEPWPTNRAFFSSRGFRLGNERRTLSHNRWSLFQVFLVIVLTLFGDVPGHVSTEVFFRQHKQSIKQTAENFGLQLFCFALGREHNNFSYFIREVIKVVVRANLE